MNRSWLFPVVIVAATSGGCGPSLISHRLSGGVEKLQKDWSAAQTKPASQSPQPLVVHLDAAPVYGCFVSPAVLGTFRPCTSFAVQSEDEAARLYAEKVRSREAIVGYSFGEVDAVVANILQKRLSESFPQARVAHGGAVPAGAIQIKLHFSIQPSVRGEQATTRLVAQLPDGRSVSSTGSGVDQFPSGHLGWAIPVMLIGFPISLPLVQMGLVGLRKGVRETAVARSVDQSAADLTSQLVAAFASGGGGAPPPVGTAP